MDRESFLGFGVWTLDYAMPSSNQAAANASSLLGRGARGGRRPACELAAGFSLPVSLSASWYSATTDAWSIGSEKPAGLAIGGDS